MGGFAVGMSCELDVAVGEEDGLCAGAHDLDLLAGRGIEALDGLVGDDGGVAVYTRKPRLRNVVLDRLKSQSLMWRIRWKKGRAKGGMFWGLSTLSRFVGRCRAFWNWLATCHCERSLVNVGLVCTFRVLTLTVGYGQTELTLESTWVD